VWWIVENGEHKYWVVVMTANNQVAEASIKYLADVAGQALPAGYKQTEVGVIPEDWDVVSLGENANYIGSGRRKRNSLF
jgi:type I restriction enzyme S subunit